MPTRTPKREQGGYRSNLANGNGKAINQDSF